MQTEGERSEEGGGEGGGLVCWCDFYFDLFHFYKLLDNPLSFNHKHFPSDK